LVATRGEVVGDGGGAGRDAVQPQRQGSIRPGIAMLCPSLIDRKKGKTVVWPVQATDDAGRRSWSDHRMLRFPSLPPISN
jgi:hypothetical protein